MKFLWVVLFFSGCTLPLNKKNKEEQVESSLVKDKGILPAKVSPQIDFYFSSDDDPSDPDQSCALTDFKAEVIVKFLSGLNESTLLPVGILSNEQKNLYFDCENCGEVAVSKKNESYKVSITPLLTNFGDKIFFQIKSSGLQSTGGLSYNETNKKSCTLETMPPLTEVEEPDNQNMISSNFASLTKPSSFLLPFLGVASQGNKNSCVSFSGNYAMFYYNYIAAGEPILSSYGVFATSPDFAYFLRPNPSSCSDTITFNFLFNTLKNYGTPSFSVLPYSSSCTGSISPEQYSSALDSKIIDTIKIDSKSIESIKGALMLKNPLLFSIKMSKKFKKIRSSNPLWNTNNDEILSGGHALTLTGYTDNYNNTGEGAFRFLNSWGGGFGDQGQGWIKYSDFLSVNIVPGNFVYMLLPSAKPSQFQQNNVTQDLTLAYSFNNTFEPSVGNISAQAFSTSFVEGKSQQAVKFQGNESSYISLGNNFNFSNGFSFSFWVKTENGTQGQQAIISNVYQNNMPSFEIGIDNNKLYTISPSNNSFETSLLSTEELLVNTWNHVVLSWNKTYLVTYLNNKLVNFKVVVKNDFPTILNNNLIIGKRPLNSSGVSSLFFNGSLDDLKIYSRSINNLEVDYLYNN